MANQEEQTKPNENNEQSKEGMDDAQQTGSGSPETTSGHKKDPVHNTGDERMMIDEEGAEVKPDDQV